MRTVIEATAFGGPEVLEVVERPDPVPAPGEVVVDVAYAPVLFVETLIRSGAGQDWFPMRPPYVPGAGVAGRVVRTGTGVDPAWIGKAVIADSSVDGEGGYAERVATVADGLIPVPDGLGLDQAAALLHDGRTAYQLADLVAVKPGERVLVTAAAGGLGALLIQLAGAAGAEVVGAARDERKRALIEELGAFAVDYSAPDWTGRVRAAFGGADVDVVLDGAGGPIGTAAFELAGRGARFSGHGNPAGGFSPVDPAEAARRGVTLFGIQDVQLDRPTALRQTGRALADAAAGRIRPVIGQRFALTEAASAHIAAETRNAIGKTVLVV